MITDTNSSIINLKGLALNGWKLWKTKNFVAFLANISLNLRAQAAKNYREL